MSDNRSQNQHILETIKTARIDEMEETAKQLKRVVLGEVDLGHRGITPNHIEVALHYHTSPAPHPRVDAPAVQDAIAYFVHHEILEAEIKTQRGWAVTARGRAWIEMLCRTPFPEIAFVDPRTGEPLPGRNQ